MPHIDVGGTMLEYLEQGAGEPIVLVHGVLGDLRVWRNQIEPFSQKYRVIAYSRRNHYPNPWSSPPGDYSLNVERDDLVGVVNGLGLGKIHLVGNSYGAAVAAVAARDNPELIRSLVLNDPALRALVASEPGFDQVNERSERVIAMTKDSISKGDTELGARTWTDWLTGDGSFDRLPPVMRTVIVQNARPLVYELSESPQPFTCEDAGRIRAPCLLISGEQTAMAFRRISEKLAQCMSQSERVMVSGASHAPYRQNAQFFNQVVLGFIAKH